MPGGLRAEEVQRRIFIGLAGDVLAPTGASLNEFYNTGFGVSVTGQYEFNRYLVSTLTVNYASFPADAPDDVTVEDGSVIPVVAGLKVCLPAGNIRFFVALDAGVASLSRAVRSTPDGPASSSSTTEFVWQSYLGFESKLGNDSSVEISSRYVGIQQNDLIAIRIGILFGI